MPFPFFSLPFELRHMIYQDLFTPADKGRPIAPYVAPLRRDHDPPGTQNTILLKCLALPFIRTCHQAYEEGTDVLYSVNTFRFGDSPNEQKEMTRFMDVFAPFCEFIYMYAFLSAIGEANRLKIRHLELRFYVKKYTVWPEERNWTAHTSDDSDRTTYIIDALNYLSRSHRLRSLDLYFYGRSRGMAEFSIWFSKNSSLLRTLVQFKAIEKMRCHVENPPSHFRPENAQYFAYKKAVNNYQELKVKLAAAYQLERGQIESLSAENGFQNDSLSQFRTWT